MRMAKEFKYLLGLGCAALLAGCYNPGKDSAYYSSYPSSYTSETIYTSQSAPAESLRIVESSRTIETQAQDQGATGSQMQQTAGSGQIQSERIVIPLHEEQVVVGTRTTDAGTVRLRKQIVTETVNQPVQIRKETIVVDREPASGTSTTQSSQQSQGQSGALGQTFGEGEIVVRLQREEPVFEKRVVSAGNIVVETRATTEQTNVQQQIRREKIEVDKGNAQGVTISEDVTQSTGAPQPEPQRYQEQSTTTITTPPTTTPSGTELEYRAPVTTQEAQPFPRPQPDGKETFPALDKNPERQQ